MLFLFSSRSMSNSTQIPRLADVGILELLRNDDRPTFVLGPADSKTKKPQRPEIVFTNTALDTFLTQHTRRDAFTSWSESLALKSKEHTGEWTFAGRVWTSTLVADTWLVVYCAQALPLGVAQTPERIDASRKSARVTRAGPPTWQILSPSSNEPPEILDWTKFDVPGVSSHIRFIKDFDWSQWCG